MRVNMGEEGPVLAIIVVGAPSIEQPIDLRDNSCGRSPKTFLFVAK